MGDVGEVLGVLVQVAACVALIFATRSFGSFTAELRKTRDAYEQMILLDELVLEKLLLEQQRRRIPVQPDYSEDVSA